MGYYLITTAFLAIFCRNDIKNILILTLGIYIAALLLFVTDFEDKI